MNMLRGKPAKELVLRARTAEEMMTRNPVSIGQESMAGEAAAFLVRRGISAAPVIDQAGRPVGVVSRSDLLAQYPNALVDHTPVYELMTPKVFCVRPDTTAREVIDTLVSLGVRRLFVVDDSDVLIGVISAWDVLCHLRGRKRRAVRV